MKNKRRRSKQKTEPKFIGGLSYNKSMLLYSLTLIILQIIHIIVLCNKSGDYSIDNIKYFAEKIISRRGLFIFSDSIINSIMQYVFSKTTYSEPLSDLFFAYSLANYIRIAYEDNIPCELPKYDPDLAYEILGLDKNTKCDQIRKKYFELARKCYPDKGGEDDEFRKIRNAYRSLCPK